MAALFRRGPKWVAGVVWLGGTIYGLVVAFAEGLGIGMSPTRPPSDAGIWAIVLFGPPYVLLPAWLALTGVCFFVIFRKSRCR